MESSLNINVIGKNVSEKMETLHNITRNNSILAEQVVSYSTFIVEQVKILAKTYTTENDLSVLVHKIVFRTLIRGMVEKYTVNNSPKFHHWLPVAYMKPFGRATNRNSKVRAHINGVSFNHKVAMDVETTDRSFAHDPTNGEGFYHLAIEASFSNIETLYACARETLKTDINDIFSIVHILTFFVMQSARNPNPLSGEFVAQSIIDIVDLMIKNLHKMNELYAVIGSSHKRLPFTPYVPDKIRHSHGQRYILFPVMPNIGMLISDTVITVNADSMIEKFREDIVENARRKDSVIFGITAKDL